METLVDIGLRNAALAIPIGLLALLVGLLLRKPALAHLLWVLVLFRLVMPAMWNVTVPRPTMQFRESASEQVASAEMNAAVQSSESPDEQQPSALQSASGMPAEPTGVAQHPLQTATVNPTSSIGEDSSQEPGEAKSVGATEAPLHQTQRLPALLSTWRGVVGCIWLLCSGLLAAVTTVRLVRFCLALRKSLPAPDSVQAIVRQLGRRLEINRVPRVRIVNARVSPMLYGFFGQPVLILPEPLWSRLDRDQQAALLTHELAHYRRGDHWVRVLELISGVLFWWHPLYWIARRQLRETEEQCCDAWVVWALPDLRRNYATAIVDTVGFLSEGRSQLPALASGIGEVRHLRRRLTMIMRGSTPRRLPRMLLASLLGGGLAFATLGTTWASDDPRSDPPAPPREVNEPPTPPAPPTPRGREDPTERQPAAPRRLAPPSPDRDGSDAESIQRELERARWELDRARERVERLERMASKRERVESPEKTRDAAPQPRNQERRPGARVETDANPAPPGSAPRGTGAARDATPRAGGPPSARGERSQIEQRMETLERQLREMIRQMEDMRREMERTSGRPVPSRPPSPPALPPA
jgi:beta-lactamase regulating signal transducer with metallopeptidase domain